MLTRRSFVNMSRDMGYYWLRIMIYIAVSICVGTVFFDVGTSYSAILACRACGGFVSGYMIFMSIGGFPSFIEEMKVNRVKSSVKKLEMSCRCNACRLLQIVKSVFKRKIRACFRPSAVRKVNMYVQN